jgi:hypothetical protein
LGDFFTNSSGHPVAAAAARVAVVVKATGVVNGDVGAFAAETFLLRVELTFSSVVPRNNTKKQTKRF